MSRIALPSYVPAFQEMDSTPERTLTFATNLRAVLVAVKDVQASAETAHPGAWEGEAGEAHAGATTRFARRLDTSEAALERAATAADRFEARLSRLAARRHALDAERREVNADIATLAEDVAAATDDTQEADLRRRADALTSRTSELTAGIARWSREYDAAEADFIAALRTVDTIGEGERAAEDPRRAEPVGLTAQLTRLLGEPAALARWWATLSRAERQALITEHPELVGRAGGVPARDRDEANRAALYSGLDRWREREADGQLSPAERRAYQNARDVRDALADHHELDPVTRRELTYLLVYDPEAHSGDGAVAVSFGDPDTADHVSVNVPGLTSEISSTSGNLTKTYALHQAAVAENRGTVASVYWLDYDAPSGNPINPLDPAGAADFDGVAFTHKAEVGGERFGDFIDGLRASDRGTPAHVTVIGHSYGSTAVGHALQDGMRVGDAILIGSPGQPEPTAAQLTEAHVWVGSKDYDPVSLLGHGDRGGIGALGHDPAVVDFGGTRFATGDGSLRIQDLLANHTSYFKGESVDNMAHIVTGNEDAVTEQPHRGAEGGEYLTLDQLLEAATAATALDGVHDVGDWLWGNSRFGGKVSP